MVEKVLAFLKAGRLKRVFFSLQAPKFMLKEYVLPERYRYRRYIDIADTEHEFYFLFFSQNCIGKE